MERPLCVACPGRGQALIQRGAPLPICIKARPGHGRDLLRRHELKARGARERAGLQHTDPPKSHRKPVGIEVDLSVRVAIPPGVSGFGAGGLDRLLNRSVGFRVLHVPV